MLKIIVYLAQSLLMALPAIIFPFLAFGQVYPDPANWQLEQVPVSDYLGSNSIKSIVEDGQGFLWLATNTGIARYDGYTFKNYPAISKDTTTLNDSRPDFAYVDQEGTLWVGTRMGINRYLPDSDCFKQYNANDAAPNTVPDGGVNWIAEDNHHQMWVASQYGGLYRYDRNNDRFERFLFRPEDSVDLSKDQVRVLLCDKDGWIWIGTGETSVSTYPGSGLIRFKPETGETRRYLHDPADEYSLLDNRVSALLQDRKGRIWVGTCNSGLHQYDPENDRFIRMLPGDKIYAKQGEGGPWTSCPHIRILHEDQWGGIWVGNYNGGLYRFDISGTNPRLFEQDPSNPDGLTNNLFWSFLEDSQGRFWFGNIIGGLYKIDPWKNKFQVHFPQKVISSVFESPTAPNVIWVAVWDEGAYRWDRKTGKYQLFQSSTPISDGPTSNRIKAFFEDSDEELWLAHDKGLSRFDRKASQFTHFPIGLDDGHHQESASIYAIHEDAEGRFWLGSWGNGIYQFDKSTGRAKQYLLPAIAGQKNNKFNQSIYVIHEDAHSRLWVGTWMDGLYQFDPKTDRFTPYLEGVGIRTIYEYEPGKFWLGTGDHGLIEFAPETGIIRSFITSDEFPGNKVYTILEDQDKGLWMGTNYGICRFNPATETFSNYDRSDGLPTYQFMDFSALKASDGTFYLGSIKGLVSFKPAQVRENNLPPILHIEDLLVFNKSYRKGEVDATGNFLRELPDQLVLPYDQNDLTFKYLGLHYTDPQLNQYRHRLRPYDQHWIEAGTEKSARYTNLNPGTYRFELLGSNSDGYWAEVPATINISILPPWWKTWWAYLLYCLAAILVVYTIYSYQKRRLLLKSSLQMEQAEAKRLKELDEFKSRFYTNITHELRTPLTIIQGLAKEIKENPRWKIGERSELISSNSNRLLHLINQMLDLSKLEAGKLKLEYIQGDIIKYLSYLVESFHSLAYSQKVTLSFHAAIQSQLMDYDPDKCQQVISNLIANAIKFTPEYGSIKVIAKVAEEDAHPFLEIEVQDTGNGIPEEKLPQIFDRFFQADDAAIEKGEGTGLGLSLVKELLELMEGSIKVKSKVDKGTTFTCRLPIRKEARMIVDDPVLQPVAFVSERTFPFTENGLNTEKKEDLPLVLIVEDNQDVIYYLRSCLENRYQILEAKNGRQGQAKAIEHLPDLVISDVMMPEIDGFELCEKLKTDERTEHIPIILLTAKVMQEDKLKGLSRGADIYLSKPFQKEELLIHIDKLIQLRRKLQQKQQLSATKTKEVEDPFLEKTRTIVESHLDDPDFNVITLSRALGLSRVQVHRKLKALSGFSTTQYIRIIRLQKAYELLKDPTLNIAEVSYQVGYRDPAHFSRSFSQHFGVTPTALRQ